MDLLVAVGVRGIRKQIGKSIVRPDAVNPEETQGLLRGKMNPPGPASDFEGAVGEAFHPFPSAVERIRCQLDPAEIFQIRRAVAFQSEDRGPCSVGELELPGVRLSRVEPGDPCIGKGVDVGRIWLEVKNRGRS